MYYAFPNKKDANPLALIKLPHGWWKILVSTELTLGNGKEPNGYGYICNESLTRRRPVLQRQPELLRLAARELLLCDSICEASVDYGRDDADFIRVYAPFLRLYGKDYNRVMATLRQLPYIDVPITEAERADFDDMAAASGA